MMNCIEPVVELFHKVLELMQLTGSIFYFRKNYFRHCTFVVVFLDVFVCVDTISAQHSFPPPVTVNYAGGMLPLLLINTEGVDLKDKSKDERIAVRLQLLEPNRNGWVFASDTIFSYNGYAGLKYRGNSSFGSSAKKPYSLELWDGWYAADSLAIEKTASLLGMPAASDWVLLAPYNDKSFIRDALMMELMRGTQDFVPRMKFCELIFNGRYYGLYVLSEKTERGKNRIDIASAKNKTGQPQECGYHLEIDRTNEPGFFSTKEIRTLLGAKESWRQKPWYQFKYPKADDITSEQEQFIRQRIDSFETVMESTGFSDPLTDYHRFIDTRSVLGFIIAQELSRNVDAYRLSTGLYKDADSKDRRFKFTLWDFNISLGNADYGWAWSTEGWSYNQTAFAAPFWFKQLFRDPDFSSSLKTYWRDLRREKLSNQRIDSVLDSLIAVTAEAAKLNNQAWQLERKTVWPVYHLASSYADELQYLRRWLYKRIAWLDDQWSDHPRNFTYNGQFESDTDVGIAGDQKVTLSQWPTLGGKPLTATESFSGTYSYEIKERKTATQIVTELVPGMYTLRVKVKTYQSPDAYIYVKNHGRTEQKVNIPNKDGDFRIIELKNVEVTSPHCEIGIAAWYSTASTTARVWYDDVELVMQGMVSGGEGANQQLWVSMFDGKIHISGNSDPVQYEIYSITGQKIRSGTIYPTEIVSLDQLSPGVYIVVLNYKGTVRNYKLKTE